jgi:hypothetical protein
MIEVFFVATNRAERGAESGEFESQKNVFNNQVQSTRIVHDLL